MKRGRLCLAVVVGLVLLLMGGCALVQAKKGDGEKPDIISAALDALMKTTKTFGEGIDKLDKITTAAEKDKAPEVKPPSALVDAGGQGMKAVAPLLPPPFNLIVGALGTLLPVGAAWLNARKKAEKRESEEALLISGLQLLKKHNPEAFAFWVKCRNASVNGKLKAEELAALLQGIEEVRARTKPVELLEALTPAA